MPTNAQDYAQALVKLHQFSTSLNPKTYFGPTIFQKEDLQAHNLDTIYDELKYWDKELEGRKYLGNTFSIADIAILPSIAFNVELLDLSLSKLPNLADWYKAMINRDSVSSTTPVAFTSQWSK